MILKSFGVGRAVPAWSEKLRASVWALSLIAGATLTPSAHGQAAYPMLMSLEPVAAQVGQTSEHTIHSRYSMDGSYAVLVSGTGVRGEVVVPEPPAEGEKKQKADPQKLQVRFIVDADALPGVRDFRLATPRGASTVGQLVITQQAVIREEGKNNRIDEAQEVKLPATICGCIERNEDVDHFRFSAAAQQTLQFHVRCQRLQDRIHDLQQHADPILTLRDAMGNAVATSDNAFFGDAFFSFTFPRAGEYVLEIRDVRYQGNKYWQYCIEVTGNPFVRGMHPLALAPEQAAEVEMVGYDLPAERTFLHVDARQPTGPQWWVPALDDVVANPAPLVVSDLPVIVELAGENGTPERAQSVNLPTGISGRIDAEGELDCFAFPAMKGESYSFEVRARRHQSALDSHLRILDLSGKQLALNDDMRVGVRTYSDSLIENWTAPADGIYVIEVRDLHFRGGEAYVYHIQAHRSRPTFELYLDTDKTQITPGTNGVIFVRAQRKNGFEGPIQLSIDGLPAGVHAACGQILAGKANNADGCIVLDADDSTQPLAANVVIRGTSEYVDAQGRSHRVSVAAMPYQETYQPGGGRGHWPVEMHTVAVAEPGDLLAVQVEPASIQLQPGGSQEIRVTIERAEGFDKNVTLDLTYNHLNRVYGSSLPPGVTLDRKQSKTLLTGKNSEGVLTLTAAKDAAAVEKQLVPVMANVSLNFVMKATYGAQPLEVSVVADTQ